MREAHAFNVRRLTTSNGRDLVIFNERPTYKDQQRFDFDFTAHTDTCNGDHTDVSGRCGSTTEE